MSKLNRIEVINHSRHGSGREYVFWEDDVEMELSYQDNDRTLKIFINDKEAIK